MNIYALNDISYGMYIITTKYQERNVGCFVNTVSQVTANNPIISVTVNKQNFTNEALKSSKKFAISVLSEKTNPKVIGQFGFFTSREKNKFENVKYFSSFALYHYDISLSTKIWNFFHIFKRLFL